MSQLERYEQKNIFEIAGKLYQHRTIKQHSIISKFVANALQIASYKLAKLLTFYLQRVDGPLTITSQQLCPQSFVIVGRYNDFNIQNPQSPYKLNIINQQRKVIIEQNQSALMLNYLHYLNCQKLGQSSIQQELSFLSSSQFLCSIPKRKLYQILRKTAIYKFMIFQTVYYEGQQKPNGIYLVRKGDFGYLKYSQRQMKQIQILDFSKGHLFGIYQINQENQTQKRQFTVKCRSHVGIVFYFPQQIYFNHIKPYCENVIKLKQDKLNKYIDKLINKNQKTRQNNTPLLSQTISRGFGLSNSSFGKASQASGFSLMNRTRLSVPHLEPLRPFLSQQLGQKNKNQTKTNYFSVNLEAASDKTKNYPLLSQKLSLRDAQFRQFMKFQRNKQIFRRVKQIKGQGLTNKGQILLSFFKNTKNFDKQKKIMLTNKKYV